MNEKRTILIENIQFIEKGIDCVNYLASRPPPGGKLSNLILRNDCINK